MPEYHPRAAVRPTSYPTGRAVATVAALLLAASAALAAGTTLRVSVANDGTPANAEVYAAGISDDGRTVVFESQADNLVPGDTNHLPDVYVRTGDPGATVRAAVLDGGLQPDAALSPAISGDGKVVAFVGFGGGLGTYGLFRRTLGGSIQRVAAFNSSEFDGASLNLSGNVIAFTTRTSLLPEDTNGLVDVYVRDYDAPSLSRVSVTSGGEQLSGKYAVGPRISRDGRFVAFTTRAVDDSSDTDVYLHDRNTGTTSPVTTGLGGAPANGASSGGAISADGRFVVFYSRATNLVPGPSIGGLFVRDVVAGTTSQVNFDSRGSYVETFGGDISGDGRRVAFDGRNQVFVRDLQTGATQVVSVSTSGEPANRGAGGARISGDGRSVAFASASTNLAPGETGGIQNVYWHDLSQTDFSLPSAGNPQASPNPAPPAGGDVILSLDAGDDAAVATATALVTGPDFFEQSVPLSLANGTPQGGTWRGVVSLPANATTTAKSYDIAFLVRDSSGNERSLAFTVSVGGVPPDTQKPSLTGPAAAPARLRKTGGRVALTVRAADNVGVTEVRAEITKPDGRKATVSLARSSGSARSGAYRATFTAPANRSRRTAVYRVVFVAQDAAGNERRTPGSTHFVVVAGSGGA